MRNIVGGASVKGRGEQGCWSQSYHHPVLDAAGGTLLCLDADGFNVHLGGVVEEWVDVGGDPKDVEEGDINRLIVLCDMCMVCACVWRW